MDTQPHEAAQLERVNYLAILPVAEVTPGLDVVLRDDVILSSSSVFPAPDTTHACQLRTTPQAASSLIDEVISYFRSRDLPVVIYLSPACTPVDLPDRLAASGFVPSGAPESWVVLDDLSRIQYRSRRSDIEISVVEPDTAQAFAETFLAAFEQPVELAPLLLEVLRPSIGVPTVTHYLAREAGQWIGTVSLTTHDTYGILGSVGILPTHRRSSVSIELFDAAYKEAQQRGLTTMFAQTELDSTAEQLLTTNHFRRAFLRQAYTLPD